MKPDLIIGPRHDPQTIRWHLIVWRGWQLSLHKWLRSDSDRAPHDHKADNWSMILWGSYVEHHYAKHIWCFAVRILPLIPVFRRAESPHRVELRHGAPVWSLWLRAPERRRWGYWCPSGTWVDADEYNQAADYYGAGISEVGKGCG